MANDTDLSKELTAAKSRESKALTALKVAVNGDDAAAMGKASADHTKAVKASEKVAAAITAVEGAQWTGQVTGARETLEVALNGDALKSAMEVLVKAQIKFIDIELVAAGNYTVSTRSGKRGRQAGTVSGPREKYSIKNLEWSAGEVIKRFGPDMANFEERSAQIADNTNSLTRKDFAREITEAMEGTVLEPVS